jgi:copper oxidase (laccase) domain-containing protein
MEIFFQDKVKNFTVAVANQADGCWGRQPESKEKTVLAARQRVWQSLGIALPPAWLKPRGCQTVILPGQNFSGVYRAQGLISHAPASLNLLAADCPALVLFSARPRLCGLLHFGWRQAIDGSLNNFLQAWCRVGGEWSQTQAVITPGICGRCYRLTGWRGGLRQAGYKILGATEFLRSCSEGCYLDLAGGLLKKISARGIKQENIFFSEVCTKENTQYYSHRRQGRKRQSNNLIIAYFA